MKWNAELLRVPLHTLWRTSGQDAHKSFTKTDFFSLLPQRVPLCMVVWAEWTRCTTTAVEEQTPEGSEIEEAPWSVNCLLPAHWQTVETPLGWVNMKLCAFLQMLIRASPLDQGWKFQGRGIRGVCQHWHSGGGGPDHTGETWRIWPAMTTSTPPLFVLEIASSTLEAWNGSTNPCIDFWGDHLILNTDAMRTPGVLHVKDPTPFYPTQQIKPCSKS